MARQWLTTAPDPHTRDRSYDAGQKGWRTHAVEAEDSDKFSSISQKRSACGILPAHGWSLDLFVEKKCARCLRKLGLACPKCNARPYAYCGPCTGTGERDRIRSEEARPEPRPEPRPETRPETGSENLNSTSETPRKRAAKRPQKRSQSPARDVVRR